MSDLDREIRQAIKAEVERSLEGWTFTPAMRQAVLERIAAEEAPAATPDSSRRTVLGPAAWIAAAAAALILAINLWPDMQPGPRSGALQESASMAASGAASGGDPLPQGDLRMKATMGAAEDESGEVAALTAQPDPVVGADAAMPAKLVLRVEELEAEMVTRGTYDDGGMRHFALLAAPTTMLDLNRLQDGNVALLTSASIKVMDTFGNVVAEEPLDYEPVALADGPADEAVVIGDSVIARYRADGQPADVLNQDTAPNLVAVAADRTAVADDGGVTVYAGGEQVFAVDGVQAEAIALAEDGALAVLTDTAGAPRLKVYAAAGGLILDQPTGSEGSALAFLGDGSRVAAGSEVYDRSGQLLWTLPFAATRVVAAGGGRMLAWNTESVALLQEETGQLLWMADAEDGEILQAVSSAGGDLVAIVAQSGEGAGVWVIDATGAQRYTEWLAEVPVDVAIAGDHLHILTPGGLEVRSLSQ